MLVTKNFCGLAKEMYLRNQFYYYGEKPYPHYQSADHCIKVAWQNWLNELTQLTPEYFIPSLYSAIASDSFAAPLI